MDIGTTISEVRKEYKDYLREKHLDCEFKEIAEQLNAIAEDFLKKELIHMEDRNGI